MTVESGKREMGNAQVEQLLGKVLGGGRKALIQQIVINFNQQLGIARGERGEESASRSLGKKRLVNMRRIQKLAQTDPNSLTHTHTHTRVPAESTSKVLCAFE